MDADFFHGFEAGFVFEFVELGFEFDEFSLGDLRVGFDITEFTGFAVRGLHTYLV